MATNRAKRRLSAVAAAFAAVVFAAASVHSTVFIFVHADHSHAHGGHDDACGVCAHLAVAAAMVKSFAPPAASAPVPVAAVNPPVDATKIIDSYKDASTPVLLKVRLNN